MRRLLRKYRAEAAVLTVFLISRVAYYAAGVRFDSKPVLNYWQFIDPALMRTDLLRSLYYLHMQPPGFNLLSGAVVKWFPEAYPAVLQGLFLALGAATAVLMVRLMELLRVPAAIAIAATTIFIVTPGVVLTENFATYEYLILFLVTLAAFLLYRLFERPGAARSLAFFGALLALVFARNQFHLIYLVAIAAALLWFLPHARGAVLAGAIPAIAATAALYFKNWILFGAFTGSTWMGMTTGVVTTFQMTPGEIENYVSAGVVTPMARIPPFAPLPVYDGLVEPAPKTGIAVLDDAFTSTGHPNYNALTYLRVHAEYFRNSMAVMRHFPQAYVRSCAIAWFTYFLPSSDLHSFDDAREDLEPFDQIFSAVFFGKFLKAESRKELRQIKASGNALSLILYTGIFLMILLPAIFVWNGAQLAVARLRLSWSGPQLAALAFMFFNIAFVTGVSNFLSTFENNRYRFPLDASYTVLAAAGAAQWLRRGKEPAEGAREESAIKDFVS